MRKDELETKLAAQGCHSNFDKAEGEMTIYYTGTNQDQKAVAWVSEKDVALFGFYFRSGMELNEKARAEVAKSLAEYATTKLEDRKKQSYKVRLEMNVLLEKKALSSYHAEKLVMAELKKEIPSHLHPYISLTAELF